MIEASIFVAYVQNQDVLAKRTGVSYLNRHRSFSVSAMYAEISSWIKSSQGKASGGLKGMFERFGDIGGLQKPEGGSGRFCDSCMRTVFKVCPRWIAYMRIAHITFARSDLPNGGFESRTRALLRRFSPLMSRRGPDANGATRECFGFVSVSA